MTGKRKGGKAATSAPLEIAGHLDNEVVIAEHLSLAARDENPALLLKAPCDVAKAHGMAHVAKVAGLGRESLDKSLAPGAKPRFETVVAMCALDLGFAIEERPHVDHR